MNLQSAFNADRRMLQDKISDLERKLNQKMKDAQQLEHQISIMNQQDNSKQNEINFWNGKVSTLKRDLEFQSTFTENIQLENRKLQADVENLTRVLDLKEKDLKLMKKQVDGL